MQALPALPLVGSRSKAVNRWLPFLGILTLFAILILPTINRMGIGWDEQVDLQISQSYLTRRGFFFGIEMDPSQTRLPMFVVSLVFRLFGTSNLLIARCMSVLVGGLTLLGVYMYGKQYFNHKVGLLAAALLAFNPYFLAFSRLAFTESDIYLAFTFTWLLFFLARFQDRPTIGRAAVAALFLGGAISSKATAVVVLPSIWIFLFSAWFLRARNHQKDVDRDVNNETLSARVVWFWTAWSVLLLLVGIGSGLLLDLRSFSLAYRLLRYLLIGVGWLLPFVWAIRFRKRSAGYLSLAIFLTGFGLLTFVVFPPEHINNSDIFHSLFLRAEGEISFNIALMGEVTALHLLTLFFKSTPVLGFALFAGTIASLAHWRKPEVLLPLLIAANYFAGLLLLPLVQTFYTIPILPLLSLLLANSLQVLWLSRKKVALAAAVLTIAWWGVEMVQCYPDYHLNGYQWVGARSLFGRSSIGYRSVVFTPADGVQQAMEWLNDHARPGQVAQLFVAEKHIVRRFAPDPVYRIEDGFEGSLSSQPDFVVVHINSLLSQGHGTEMPETEILQYPFDREVLERGYDQVFAVKRAFGLEMASVWQRK